MRFCLLLLTTALLSAQTPAQVETANRAKSLLAQNKFAEAAVLYTELVQAIPNNPGLLLNQGMALHMSGADAKAIAPLEAALKLNPGIPPALLFLGASYLRTGQPAKALTPLEKFVSLDPNHVEARQMLVDAANTSGQQARAIPHLEKLGLLYDLGRTYEALAANTFTQLEKLYPESGPFFAILAATRSSTSQRRAAFFFYRKALEKSPTLRGLRPAIAVIYRANDHPEWALSEEAAEAKLPPLVCKPTTAECEFNAGRYQAALRLARTNSLLDLYWRTRTYNALAAATFTRLTTQSPTPASYRYLAETARAQNRHTEAAEAWRGALKLERRNPTPRISITSRAKSTSRSSSRTKPNHSLPKPPRPIPNTCPPARLWHVLSWARARPKRLCRMSPPPCLSTPMAASRSSSHGPTSPPVWRRKPSSP
jgi:tetratricopeptide (TPR) repeat protein